MLKHRVINSGLQVFDFLTLTACFKLKATFKPFLAVDKISPPIGFEQIQHSLYQGKIWKGLKNND